MTASFDLEFDGVRRVRNDLRFIAAAMPDVTDEEMGNWARETRGYLKGKGYPPAPAPKPGRKAYVRTGQLANRWAVEHVGRGSYAIVNRAVAKGRVYAAYPIGSGDGSKPDQAYMHKGRWWLARHEIKQVRLPLLRKRMEVRFAYEFAKRGMAG